MKSKSDAETIRELEVKLAQAQRDADNNARWFKEERRRRYELEDVTLGLRTKLRQKEQHVGELIEEASVAFQRGHAQATKFEARRRAEEFTIGKIMRELKENNGIDREEGRTEYRPLNYVRRGLDSLFSMASNFTDPNSQNDKNKKKVWADTFIALLDYAILQGWDEEKAGQMILKTALASRWSEIRTQGHP